MTNETDLHPTRVSLCLLVSHLVNRVTWKRCHQSVLHINQIRTVSYTMKKSDVNLNLNVPEHESTTPKPEPSTMRDHPFTKRARTDKPSFLSVFLTILWSCFLIFFTCLLLILTFIYGLAQNIDLPSIGSISGEWWTSLFRSQYMLIFSAILAIIPILVLMLIHSERIRRAFFFIGLAYMITSVISLVFAYSSLEIIPLFSGEWQKVLTVTNAVFKDLSMIFSLLLIAIGSLSLSINACIYAIKGGSHEEAI